MPSTCGHVGRRIRCDRCSPTVMREAYIYTGRVARSPCVQRLFLKHLFWSSSPHPREARVDCSRQSAGSTAALFPFSSPSIQQYQIAKDLFLVIFFEVSGGLAERIPRLACQRRSIKNRPVVFNNSWTIYILNAFSSCLLSVSFPQGAMQPNTQIFHIVLSPISCLWERLRA